MTYWLCGWKGRGEGCSLARSGGSAHVCKVNVPDLAEHPPSGSDRLSLSSFILHHTSFLSTSFTSSYEPNSYQISNGTLVERAKSNLIRFRWQLNDISTDIADICATPMADSLDKPSL